VLLPSLLLEGSHRVYQLFRRGTPLSFNPIELWDETLGWRGREHVLSGENETSPILVIGDSFTEGLGVPTEKMWFASLRERFPKKTIIAYGGLGYGNLQHLLVIRDYLNRGVSPEYIIIQLCTNDIINNYFPLEKRSLLQRAPAPRPYLIKDQIRVKLPRNYDSLLLPLISYSRLAYALNNRLDGELADLASKGNLNSIEFQIGSENRKSLYLYRKALKVTAKIIKEIKQSAEKSKLIFVLIDDVEPYTTSLKKIANRYRIPIIIPAHNYPISLDGKLADGTHYNEYGNNLIGKRVLQEGEARGVF
jgi:lysophospholipase L1-like esterase